MKVLDLNMTREFSEGQTKRFYKMNGERNARNRVV